MLINYSKINVGTLILKCHLLLLASLHLSIMIHGPFMMDLQLVRREKEGKRVRVRAARAHYRSVCHSSLLHGMPSRTEQDTGTYGRGRQYLRYCTVRTVYLVFFGPTTQRALCILQYSIVR